MLCLEEYIREASDELLRASILTDELKKLKEVWIERASVSSEGVLNQL